MGSFVARYGKRALVTGAGAGIGAAFAESLAKRGIDLVLVDMDARALDRVALHIGGRVDVHVVVADLATTEGLARTVALVDDDIGLVVSNAGVSQVGAFTEISLDVHEHTLDVNARAMLHIVHAAATRMRARGRGGIVMLSSSSGLLHSPFVAQYAGTKAYTLALGEAIHEELRGHGVDVLVVLPGLTRTQGLTRANIDEGAAGQLLTSAHEVAERSLRALGKASRVFPNPRDRFGAALMLALPRRSALALNARTMLRFFPDQLRKRLSK
jgi:short-subunit dehydrogenase